MQRRRQWRVGQRRVGLALLQLLMLLQAALILGLLLLLELLLRRARLLLVILLELLLVLLGLLLRVLLLHERERVLRLETGLLLAREFLGLRLRLRLRLKLHVLLQPRDCVDALARKARGRICVRLLSDRRLGRLIPGSQAALGARLGDTRRVVGRRGGSRRRGRRRRMRRHAPIMGSRRLRREPHAESRGGAVAVGRLVGLGNGSIGDAGGHT
mmetsp:Transcript_5672/g.17441  ORF Transcript_5672/g.17441 Transcript_5672/m.17441 type:complete len:214 (+) Transcript_5672:1146-1787(+)